MSNTNKEEEPAQLEVGKPAETLEGAARQAAQVEKEQQAVTALAGEEAEAPPSAEAEMDVEEQAREIAQRYLETISGEDRELTDPTQVKHLLYILENAINPGSHLFSNVDKLGNMPAQAYAAFRKEDCKGVAQAWQGFVDDPVGVAKEMDKVRVIATGTLPESVRTAFLSIILKEGNYSAVAMAKDVVKTLEETGNLSEIQSIREKYRSPETLQMNSMRQGAARELLKALYPDLMESEEATLLIEMSRLPHEKRNDRRQVTAMAERYNSLAGNIKFSMDYKLPGVTNGKELLAKLQDESIAEKKIGEVISILQRELRQYIAEKAVSADSK